MRQKRMPPGGFHATRRHLNHHHRPCITEGYVTVQAAPDRR